MNENENKDMIIETESENLPTENITSGIKEKGKGLAIASVVTGAIAFIIGAFCLYLSISSVILTNQGGESEDASAGLSAGLSAIFMALYMIIFAIADGIIAVTSLGLGIGSLSKSCDKKTKSIGISGVTLSGVAILCVVVSLVIRFVLYKQ